MIDKAMTKDLMNIVDLDGIRQEDVRGFVQPKEVLIPDRTVDLAPGFHIEAKLPNGRVSEYIVEDVQFYSKDLGGGFDFYQVKVRQVVQTARPSHGTTSVVYNVSGPNARVNVRSTDSSVNIAQVDVTTLYEKLRETTRQNLVPEKQSSVIEAINRMEASRDPRSTFVEYGRFIGLIADHLTVYAPFMPALSQVLQQLAT